MRYLSGFTKIATLLTDRRGVTAIEYALVASLISVAAVVSFENLGSQIDNQDQQVNSSL